MTSYDQMAYLKIQSLQFIFLGKWKDTQRSRAQFSITAGWIFALKKPAEFAQKKVPS